MIQKRNVTLLQCFPMNSFSADVNVHATPTISEIYSFPGISHISEKIQMLLAVYIGHVWYLHRVQGHI